MGKFAIHKILINMLKSEYFLRRLFVLIMSIKKKREYNILFLLIDIDIQYLSVKFNEGVFIIISVDSEKFHCNPMSNISIIT